MRSLGIVLILLLSSCAAAGQRSAGEETALSCVVSSSDFLPAECSTLDFEVEGVDPAGRYSVLIDRVHALWLADHDATASAWDHIHQLNMFNALNNCSVDDSRFIDCRNVMNDPEQACMEQGGYSNWSMRQCASIRSRIIGLVLAGEIALMVQIMIENSGPDQDLAAQLESIQRSQVAWESFVSADCRRAYLAFAPGRIASLTSIACSTSHNEYRLSDINQDNRIHDEQIDAVDIDAVFSSIAL